MKAALLHGPGKVSVEDIPVPEPGEGEVRLRVTCVGVCGSDVHIYVNGRIGEDPAPDGHMVGHEFAGVIDKLGPGLDDKLGPGLEDARGFEVGQRVVPEPGINCGKCEPCVTGHPNQCRDIVFYGHPPAPGTYCEYVVHPAHLCYPIPDEVTDEDAATLEPLGIGLHVVRRVGVDLGDMVAVLGSGPIGLVTMMCARAAGASRVLATDIREYRAEFARKLCADEVMSPQAGDQSEVEKWVMELTHGRGVDAAFECAGVPETPPQCYRVARKGGRVGLVGIPEALDTTIPAHVGREKELDVRHVMRSRFTVEAGLAMARSGQVDLRTMVTHRFALDEIEKAFELVHDYADGVVKAMIVISEP